MCVVGEVLIREKGCELEGALSGSSGSFGVWSGVSGGGDY